MNAASAAAPAWRQFTFFDVVPVTDVHDLASSPEILRNAPEISVIIPSSVGVLVADIQGRVHVLDKTFEAVRSWVAHAGGRVTHMAESKGILVTLGEEARTRLPVLNIWDLEHFDKKTGYPVLLRAIKIPNNTKRPHPITTIALSDSLSHLAIGVGDGTVLLYRHLDQSLFSGSTSLAALPKPKTVHQSPAEPITGLGFREPPPATDLDDKPDTTLHLFIVTTNRVLCYVPGGKGSGAAPTVVDEVGCGLGCAVMDRRAREMLVARDEAIYMCGPDGRGACYAYEGSKSSVYSHKTYAVIVSPPFYPNPSNPSATVRNFVARTPDPSVSQKDISKVTVFDVENKFVAFSGPFKEGVHDVVCQWGQIFILTNDGKLSRLEEKSTATKLDILFRQSRYLLALNIANTLGVDESGIADIHRQYGDHLYLKADYDGAMQQFVKTLGYLQPSYVIRKFLDAQRIHNLTTYLQELHARGLANSDHTTLLLNTYTKLKDVSRLDSFIKTESHRKSTNSKGEQKDSDLPFDLETAIRVCRQAGYFEHAAYLAKKYNRHEDYLRIQIEDSGNYKEALAYLRQLGPEAAESNLARYGRSMLLNLPDEMTQMLIDLCSGTTFLVATPQQDAQPSSPTKAGGPNYLSYLGYNRGGLSLPSEPVPPATPVTTTAVATVLQQDQVASSHVRTGTNRTSQNDGEDSPSPPPSSQLVNNRRTLRKRPSPTQYFAQFVDHLEHFLRFLEAIALNRWGLSLEADVPISAPSTPPIPDDIILDETSDLADQVAVWNTLLELYLTLSSRLRQNQDLNGASVLHGKALRLLKNDSVFGYDITHALIVCSTRNFTEGLVLLWEKMGMYEDILRFWMEKENSGDWNEADDERQRPSWKVLHHLEVYGPAHPHLYPLVLRFFTSTPALLTRHTDNVMDILRHIDKETIIPPLGVVQILSRNGVASVGLLKEWLLGHITQSREDIAADQHLVVSYRNETKTKLQEIAELSDPEHPRVFHVTRCSACGGQLDLPSVHFMCKHSYHQRCLAENEAECPNCARSHGVIREIKRENERFANQHDLFIHNVEDGGFDALAAGFSRGLLGTKV